MEIQYTHCLRFHKTCLPGCLLTSCALTHSPRVPQAANDQIIRNLQRENAMITSAWYDLTSRLQSNHVVLQRRHDVPKSWLNKQRQIVNGTRCESQRFQATLEENMHY